MASIALVVLDTLRKDSFDAEFDWLPGRRFENAYSTGSWTVPAHASLFAGKYPSELGVHSKNRYLDCSEQTLAEALSDLGYNTSSYSCNPYISSVFKFDRGFDEFSGSWRLRHFDPDFFDWKTFISETRDEGPTRYLRALWNCVTNDCKTLPSLRHGMRLKMRGMGTNVGVAQDDGARSALKYLKKRDLGSDEFLFINLMEAHAPYTPPAEYRTVDLDQRPGLIDTVSENETFQDTDKVRTAYEDCVRYLSDIYQDIFEELSRSFDYIITLGDHGEMFGEHGVWAHTHGVYPELTHVPLVVYGDRKGGSCDAPVSVLDVHQTVLDIAGIEIESRGQSLLDNIEDIDRITEYMGFTQDDIRRLSDEGISQSKIKKYDSDLRGVLSEGGAYGYETVEGFVHEGESNKILEERLADIIETLEIREVVADSEENIPAGVRDQLEDLGYA